MKKIFLVIVFSILGIYSNSTMALTGKDCRERVNNATYNSDKLGGNDTDAYRWAQNAANECFKEIATTESYRTPEKSEGFGWGWFLLIGFLAFIYWQWYRPDVNGWAIPFFGAAEERAFKRSQKDDSLNNEDILEVQRNILDPNYSNNVVAKSPKTDNDVKDKDFSVPDEKNDSEKHSVIDDFEEDVAPELKKVARTKAFKDWHESSAAKSINKYDIIQTYLGINEIDKLAKKYSNDSYDILLDMILIEWDTISDSGDLSLDRWMRKNYKKVLTDYNSDTVEVDEDSISLDEVISAFESGFNKISVN